MMAGSGVVSGPEEDPDELFMRRLAEAVAAARRAAGCLDDIDVAVERMACGTLRIVLDPEAIHRVVAQFEAEKPDGE
jgi:hypothetical protein